jgi:DNA helicase HerA-like ATPase
MSSVRALREVGPHGTGLEIAPNFLLPVEVVTETLAIIANRGAGKSSTAVVLVEELHGAGQPVVILDPKGDW